MTPRAQFWSEREKICFRANCSSRRTYWKGKFCLFWRHFFSLYKTLRGFQIFEVPPLGQFSMNLHQSSFCTPYWCKEQSCKIWWRSDQYPRRKQGRNAATRTARTRTRTARTAPRLQKRGECLKLHTYVCELIILKTRNQYFKLLKWCAQTHKKTFN